MGTSQVYIRGIVGSETLVGDADGALVERGAGGGGHGQHGRVDGQPGVVVVVGISVPRAMPAFSRLSPTPHCG